MTEVLLIVAAVLVVVGVGWLADVVDHRQRTRRTLNKRRFR